MKYVTILLALAAVLTGCQKSSPQQADQLIPINVTYTFQPQSSLVHIAMAKGYFTQEGLDVHPIMRTFGKESLQTVLDHQSDFATVAETPVMFSILKGADIFVIANIEASTTNNAIVARKDAGIASPADLKNKRIGYTPGTTSEFFLNSMLTANGMTVDQIHTVPLKPEQMLDAITEKRVDAVSTWNYPLTLISRKLGTNAITFYDRELYTETFNVACQQDYVRKNPETVKHFLSALLKAEKFAKEHADEAQSIMALETNMDKNLIRDVWENFHYHVELNQLLVITLEDETRWAMANKLAEPREMPDFRKYIYDAGLKAIAPDVVRLNR